MERTFIFEKVIQQEKHSSLRFIRMLSVLKMKHIDYSLGIKKRENQESIY